MTIILGRVRGTSTAIPINLSELGSVYVVQHIEDTPFQVGDEGVLLLAVRNDAGGTLASASGDKTPLQVNNLGQLVVAVAAIAPVAAVVTQLVHDLLNCNANIQVGDVDVGAANPVPISAAALPLPAGAATAANQQPAATAETEYNLTMTLANTEYSQALPANTKRLTLQCRGLYDVRFAFTTGKVAGPVAPYQTLFAGMNYWEDQLSLAATTIYVACGTAAQVAEIVCWT